MLFRAARTVTVDQSIKEQLSRTPINAWNRINLVGEEVSNVSELVVNHKGQHTHLGGTALVELDGTLLELGLLCRLEKSALESMLPNH